MTLREQIISLDSRCPEDGVYRLEREHSWEVEFGSYHVAVSHCLFCPACGRIWATLSFPDETLIWPRAAFCAHCSRFAGAWDPTPGSLLYEEGWGVIDVALLAALPSVLVRREFLLHVNRVEKENDNRNEALRAA